MRSAAIVLLALALACPAAVAQDNITTGSINHNKPVPMKISIKGAPGDGNTSLADAIRSELANKGVNIVDPGRDAAFRLDVSVSVKPVQQGKAPISIEWRVKNPRGKRVGVVTQRQELDPKDIDGEWGMTAKYAAGAAAQGIIKLLQMPRD